MLTLGIDIGSTTTKIAFFDGSTFPHADLLPTGPNSRKTVARLLDEAAAKGFEQAKVTQVVSTGYGRRLMEMADSVVSEISANARGVSFVMASSGIPIRTIIDIGGQDSKVISLDAAGSIREFVMNDKCAAGTGRFLEVMARILEIEVDQLGEIDRNVSEAHSINSTCTVFAESEVVSLLARGVTVPEIVNAVHRSIASRVAALARRMSPEPEFILDGGPSQNGGLVRALEGELKRTLHVPPRPQLMAAMGAAVIAADRSQAAT
ncbi:MAG: acyl-CoA dehydratase activase [Candidatus Brocadiia bacterium]